MHSVTIDIAGFVTTLRTDDEAVAQRFRRRYGTFLSPQTEADVEVDIRIQVGAQFVVPEQGTTWVSNVSVEGNRLCYESYLVRAALDLTTRRATLTMAPNGEVENFLRTVYAWLCIENGSILLHAAGVIRDGLGYVFFGPSGAGKSTTALISAEIGHQVVSDDIIIIRKHEDGYYLHGVPFLGEMTDAPRQNASAPLAGIYRLRQDVRHGIRPMNPIMAIAELTASAPFVVQHKKLSVRVIDVCRHLNTAHPVQQLHFKRDPDFWQVIMTQ